jgi:hypothetical protein
MPFQLLPRNSRRLGVVTEPLPERVELAGLSPATWRFGWVRQVALLLATAGLVMVIARGAPVVSGAVAA